MWTSAKNFLQREREREGAEASLRKLIKHNHSRSSMPLDSPPSREIFVTVGATATFQDLIQRVGSEEFQKTARELGFTQLTIQCGNSMDFYHHIKCEEVPGLNVKTFGFSSKGLGQEMRGTLEGEGRRKGVVISHAGAGSILDAMRLCCSIIVVPNESLLDNHQVELAQELEKQGYVTRGTVKDLSHALRRSELESSEYTWPPPKAGKSMADIIDETVVKEEVVKSHLD